MTTDVPEVHLYTDGACSGNPGPGGWAYILQLANSDSTQEATGNEPRTTNNRMELMAVIEGLSALPGPSKVELFSDSQYVLKGLEEWMPAWKARGWKTSSKKPVKNQDLWQQLDLLAQQHQISFNWIQGHTGHPENERADELAVQARNLAAI